VSWISWDPDDCPRAVRIYEQPQPDHPPYGPPWDGLVSHWICQTSKDLEDKHHWVECRWVYNPEEEVYGRDCDIITCEEVIESYALGKLAEVGASPPDAP